MHMAQRFGTIAPKTAPTPARAVRPLAASGRIRLLEAELRQSFTSSTLRAGQESERLCTAGQQDQQPPCVSAALRSIGASRLMHHRGRHRLPSPPGSAAAVVAGHQAGSSSGTSYPPAAAAKAAMPNPSFNATANGVPPGPRGRLTYHRPRGPVVTPPSAR